MVRDGDIRNEMDGKRDGDIRSEMGREMVTLGVRWRW